MKNKLAIFSAFLFLFLLTACGAPAEPPKEPGQTALEVSGQTVAQSQAVKQQYEYPAMVLSEQEAKILAKTSGTIKQIYFKSGDSVRAGALLARIDDINQGGSLQTGLSANQIKQAQLAVEQAEANKRNLALTSAENLKSAQIAYETAIIATEQAELNLKNRQASVNQSYGDIDTNAKVSVDAAVNACGTVITAINSIIGVDTSAYTDLSYKNNLGATNQQLTIDVKNTYDQTKSLYEDYRSANLSDVETIFRRAAELVNQTGQLADTTKRYLDASLIGGALTSTVLSGFQSSVAGYQAQINTALAQINAAKQTRENNLINSDANLDALAKAYDLAKQQEKNAQQALPAQKANIKSLLDTADMAYRNALINLQSLIDIHLVIAPIGGKITQNFIALGDTVSAGQQLAIIGSGQTAKFQFYVEETVIKKISRDQTVIIKNNENKEITGKISSLSAQADTFSKRFLVEVTPVNFDPTDFSLGTVVNIVINVEKKSDAGNVILPLSAIEIGQNGNAVFIIENGRAKKTPVEIIKISGETAEIKTDLVENAIIITSGNKLIQEGDLVTLAK